MKLTARMLSVLSFLLLSWDAFAAGDSDYRMLRAIDQMRKNVPAMGVFAEGFMRAYQEVQNHKVTNIDFLTKFNSFELMKKEDIPSLDPAEKHSVYTYTYDYQGQYTLNITLEVKSSVKADPEHPTFFKVEKGYEGRIECYEGDSFIERARVYFNWAYPTINGDGKPDDLSVGIIDYNQKMLLKSISKNDQLGRDMYLFFHRGKLRDLKKKYYKTHVARRATH